jgi:hypothetical protein
MAVWMRCLATIFIFLVCLRGSTAVAADKATAGPAIEAINKKAMAAFRKGRARVARQQLVKALALAEDSDLANTRIAARTYLNLGVVNLIGLRQRREAVHCFQQALQIAPTLRPPVSTPPVRQAMAEARRRVQRARRTELAAAPPAASSEAKSKEALGDLESIAPSVAEPAAAEDPAAGPTLAAARSEDEEAPPVSSEDPSLSGRAEPSADGRGPGSIFLGLGVGSAIGASPSRPLELHTNQSVKAGPAFGGLLHLLPEIGVQLSQSVAISLQGRHQYIRPSGGPDPRGQAPKMAHAALACLYYSLNDSDSVQWMLTAAVGGGSGFRLKVQPSPQAGVIASDTVAGGPVVFGPGLALFIHAGRSVVLTPSLRVLAGAPNLAAVAEGALGMQYAF